VARTCNCKAAQWSARGKQAPPLHRLAAVSLAKICGPYRRVGYERLGLVPALQSAISPPSASFADRLCRKGDARHQGPILTPAETSNSHGSHSRRECEGRKPPSQRCRCACTKTLSRQTALFSVPALRKISLSPRSAARDRSLAAPSRELQIARPRPACGA